MTIPVRIMPWDRNAAERADALGIGNREWLVTNGLGGYASGTVVGPTTRRYHGLLIAALPAPLGRTMMLNHLVERLRLADGSTEALGLDSAVDPGTLGPGAGNLADFRLVAGLPVWRYEAGSFTVEKPLVVERGANTIRITYRLAGGPGPATLLIRPSIHLRGHDDHVGTVHPGGYRVEAAGGRLAVSADSDIPSLRLLIQGQSATFVHDPEASPDLAFPIEADRGYQSVGSRWSPGELRVEMHPDIPVTLVASTEPWESFEATDPAAAAQAELDRRAGLLAAAGLAADDPVVAELVLAADQFLFTPAGRDEDKARARAEGNEVRSVIAGYHWFTDWGRDTMISLEGLTLATGRHAEARSILRTFAHHVRDGLIPNLFPEGGESGLYHTADATLWFFHAVNRYLRATGDRSILDPPAPVLLDIADPHLRGTRFGIGVDPADGLLRQGQEGYQLTWMDAKVDGWVVTPPARQGGRDQRPLVQRAEAARRLGDGTRPSRGRGPSRRPRRASPRVVQPPLLGRGPGPPARRRRRRIRRQPRVPPQPTLRDRARPPRPRPVTLAGRARSASRQTADARRAPVAGAERARLQADIPRRPPHPRRRLPPGDGLVLVHRALRRRAP